ncbi:flavodoxin domain-containing protein, partial [Acidithiobacillus sp.]
MELIRQSDFLLDPRKQEDLRRFAEGMTREQLLWSSGYLTGFGESAPASKIQGGTGEKITILFGTETGNAKRLAELLAARAQAMGVQSSIQDMLTYGRAQLRRDRVIVLIVSTHGDGEPPDSARALLASLTDGPAPDLHGSRFAILALGDASYPRFCQAGKAFDMALASAGAERLLPRVDCDVDYEEDATSWMEQVLGALTTGKSSPAVPLPAPILKQGYSSHATFPAVLLSKVNLSGRGSDREVWHLELDIDGSGL